jgi:site-specific DNA recombinase
MKPCFGYIRVSTIRQGDGASLDAQKDAITGFASQNNLEIIEWFEEKETASKIGRPIFERMMSGLRTGAAEGLVMHKIDRYARNYTDWSRLDEIVRLGVKIYSAADGLDFDTRGGRLLADIQMALAADYSRNLSQEVKKGIYGRLKHGIYPFRAPIGYLDTGGGNPKARDPKKAPLVKQLFKLYLTRDYSIVSLTAEMRRRGLSGYGGQPVVKRNVEAILRNPFYCGKMRVCGKLYPGNHKPLISAAVFRRVQAIKKERYGKKSTRHNFLFRGLFRCAGCQGMLTGERQKGHAYYRCHTKGCPAKTIREDQLETSVIGKFKAIQIARADRAKISKGIQQWLAQDGTKEIEKSLRLRIGDARSRQERLTDLLVDGAIDQTAYNLRKENLEFELQQLREELETVENNRAQREDFELLLDFASDLAELYAASPHSEKRRLIRNCLKDRTIGDGCVKATAADWLVELPAFGKGQSSGSPDTQIASGIAVTARGLMEELL